MVSTAGATAYHISCDDAWNGFSGELEGLLTWCVKMPAALTVLPHN